MTEIRIIVLVVVVLATVFGVGAWRKSLIAEGDKAGAARVQAEWDAVEEKRKATTAQDNVIRFRNTERISDADQKRQSVRTGNAAAVDSAVASLRNETSRLNLRRPNPDAAGDARLAACVGEATTARELLTESATAYSAVAKQADELRDQVTGLQDYAYSVCGASKSSSSSDTSTDSGGAFSSD